MEWKQKQLRKWNDNIELNSARVAGGPFPPFIWLHSPSLLTISVLMFVVLRKPQTQSTSRPACLTPVSPLSGQCWEHNMVPTYSVCRPVFLTPAAQSAYER